jgi:hypothetical protein
MVFIWLSYIHSGYIGARKTTACFCRAAARLSANLPPDALPLTVTANNLSAARQRRHFMGSFKYAQA